MRYLFRPKFFLLVMVLLMTGSAVTGQSLFSNSEDLTFMKRELNAGLNLFVRPEKEDIRTEETLFRLEQTPIAGQLFIENSNFVFLPFRQDQWRYSLQAGPFFGTGTFADSSSNRSIEADMSPRGLRLKADIDFSTRFYWDSRNFTFVQLNGWGNFDVYSRNSEGTVIDSNQVESTYTDDARINKLRYGLQAKAGWGIGRLNAVNHYANAQRLLEKHYPGKMFSTDEIRTVARAIGRIKHQRNISGGRPSEMETEQLTGFINNNLLLVIPEGVQSDWELTESRVRYQGSRVEAGPFFNYYNREPDFVYGGFIRFENHRYFNPGLNSYLAGGMNYNGYKKDDWVTFEATAGLSWYPSLSREISVGLRYLPGMLFTRFSDLHPVRHAVVPYLEYFSQLNSRYRLEAAFAYRIARQDEFVMPGPELSISIYRSWY